jgi:hypothetical protein
MAVAATKRRTRTLSTPLKGVFIMHVCAPIYPFCGGLSSRGRGLRSLSGGGLSPGSWRPLRVRVRR